MKKKIESGVTTDLGHWKNNSNQDIDTTNFGFTYQILNKTNGKRYIGRKQFFLYRRGKKVAESDWRVYCGSSKHLKSDSLRQGKEHFEFAITGQFKTRSMLRYAEANQQHKLDVLLNTDKWYNRQIDAIKSPPVEEYKK